MKVNWRPIKTAPKERGKDILLAALNGDGDFFVCAGRWVDVPRNAQLMESWKAGKTTNAQELPCDPNWRDGRAAIIESGGACNGFSWEARSDIIFEPTHWMPMPKPPTRKSRTGDRP